MADILITSDSDNIIVRAWCGAYHLIDCLAELRSKFITHVGRGVWFTTAIHRAGEHFVAVIGDINGDHWSCLLRGLQDCGPCCGMIQEKSGCHVRKDVWKRVILEECEEAIEEIRLASVGK